MKFKDRHKDQKYCVNYVNSINFGVLIITEQIPGRAVWGVGFRPLVAGSAGSNLAG
jgi:hypothetical protein